MTSEDGTARSGFDHSPAGADAISWRQSGLEFGVATALYLLGALLYLGRSMRWSLHGVLGPDQGDPLLYVYLMKWFERSLHLGFRDYWDPPFFHPLEGVLAYSDHLIGPGAAFVILRRFGLEPLAAYNLLYAGQFVAAGLALYWVLRRSSLSFPAAIAGGWWYTFGHHRWDEQSHFNVLLVATVPLALRSFDLLIAAPTWRRSLAFLLVYAVHLTGGTYLAYLLHVPLAVVAFARRRELLAAVSDRRSRALLAVTALAAAIPLGALYLAYTSRTADLRAERTVRELREHSTILASFATPSSGSPLERFVPALPDNLGRGALFPGFACSTLMIVGAAAIWRERRRELVAGRWPWLAASVAGTALILVALVAADRFTLDGERLWNGIDLHGYRGPVWAAILGGALCYLGQRRARGGALFGQQPPGAWPPSLSLASAFSLLACLPMFYWVLWSALPGMRGTRVSHRFFAFAAIGLAALIAAGFDRLLARGRRGAALAATLAAFAVVESTPHLRLWNPLPEEHEFPTTVRAVADLPDVAALLQLPIYDDWRDLRTMYLATAHWRPMINGSTSFAPPHYGPLASECGSLSTRCLGELRKYGVTHVVLVDDFDSTLPPYKRSQAGKRIRIAGRSARARVRSGELIEVGSYPDGSIYRLPADREVASRPATGRARDTSRE